MADIKRKKTNKNRRFSVGSGGHRSHPQNQQARQQEAAIRQTVTDDMTPKQRLAHLDEMLGVGQGAVKERARLQSLIDAQKK